MGIRVRIPSYPPKFILESAAPFKYNRILKVDYSNTKTYSFKVKNINLLIMASSVNGQTNVLRNRDWAFESLRGRHS